MIPFTGTKLIGQHGPNHLSRLTSGLIFIVSLLFLFGIVTPNEVHATTYYIDATNGLNGNNGLTQGTAWQTLTKASAAPVTSGDTILLKRGETWTSQTLAPASGTTIDVYGSGEKPIINGNSYY